MRKNAKIGVWTNGAGALRDPKESVLLSQYARRMKSRFCKGAILALACSVLLGAAPVADVRVSPDDVNAENAAWTSRGLMPPPGGVVLPQPYAQPYSNRSFVVPFSWYRTYYRSFLKNHDYAVRASDLRKDLPVMQFLFSKAYSGWEPAAKADWDWKDCTVKPRVSHAAFYLTDHHFQLARTNPKQPRVVALVDNGCGSDCEYMDAGHRRIAGLRHRRNQHLWRHGLFAARVFPASHDARTVSHCVEPHRQPTGTGARWTATASPSTFSYHLP